jgi:hypothetical protein
MTDYEPQDIDEAPTRIGALFVGITQGLKDFTDWDGIDKKAIDGSSVSEYPTLARIGYVVGCLIRLVAVLAVAVWGSGALA